MNGYYNSNNKYNQNRDMNGYYDLDIRDNINQDKMYDYRRQVDDNSMEVIDTSAKTKAIVIMAIMAIVIVGVLGMAIFKSVGKESKKEVVKVGNEESLDDSEMIVGDGEDSEVQFNEEIIEDTGDLVEDDGQGQIEEQDDKEDTREEVKATTTPKPTQKPTKDPNIEINEVKEKVRKLSQSDNRVVQIYNNFSRYPLNLMKDIVRNNEMIDYTVGYLEGITKSYDENIDISSNVSDTTYKIPLLIQWDTRWGYYKYGRSTVGISGCGPTALNMVYLALKGDQSMNPLKMAKFSTDYGYCVPGVGTSWSLMTEGAAKLGITSSRLSKTEDNMKTSLEQGKYIIASMGPGVFTETGHFIVFSGYENGKFRINDPFCLEHSRRSWNYSEFASQVKALWVLSN